MTNDTNQDFNTNFFRNKNFKKFLLVTVALVALIFIIAVIFNGKNISSIILSDYYFVVGIILLILSALARGVAWGIHKKSILKPHQGNQNDSLLAKDKLKLLTKILAFMGAVNMFISLLFTMILY